MIIDAKNIKFETQNDVIDYVAKGIPPRKKNFNQFIEAIGDSEQHAGPYVPPGILNVNSEDMKDILHEVYKANKRNSITYGAIAIGSLLFGIGIGCLIGGKGDNANEEEDSEEVITVEF